MDSIWCVSNNLIFRFVDDLGKLHLYVRWKSWIQQGNLSARETPHFNSLLEFEQWHLYQLEAHLAKMRLLCAFMHRCATTQQSVPLCCMTL